MNRLEGGRQRPQLVGETGRGRVEDCIEFAQIRKCFGEIAGECVEGFCGDECCDDVVLMIRVARDDGGRLTEDRRWLWGHLGCVLCVLVKRWRVRLREVA